MTNSGFDHARNHNPLPHLRHENIRLVVLNVSKIYDVLNSPKKERWDNRQIFSNFSKLM